MILLENQVVMNQKKKENEWYQKLALSKEIISLVNEIKRRATFDSILWNLNNVSTSELERKSLEELNQISSNLKRRLVELTTTQKQTRDITREKLEEAKWTGQKPRGLTDYEFDRLQRDEAR